jgi:patatin-like phospholipase/acyl hydrolase
MSDTPLYILSLNGGGVRGLATIAFLCKMTAYLKTLRPSFELHTFFDIYAGTSIGALINGFLLVTGKTPEELKLIFKNNIGSIMKMDLTDFIFGIYQTKPKYDGRDKEKFIKSIIGDHKFSSFDKTVIVTAIDVKYRQARIFNSTKVNPALLTSDIINASSAAPCYFPSVRVNNSQDKDEPVRHGWFLDGALIANNPTVCALTSIDPVHKHRRKIVVNIGTGYKVRTISGEKSEDYGTFQWFSTGILTLPANDQLVEQQAKLLLATPDSYLQIDGELPKYMTDTIDDYNHIYLQNLVNLGEQWWDDNKVKFANFFDL